MTHFQQSVLTHGGSLASILREARKLLSWTFSQTLCQNEAESMVYSDWPNWIVMSKMSVYKWQWVLGVILSPSSSSIEIGFEWVKSQRLTCKTEYLSSLQCVCGRWVFFGLGFTKNPEWSVTLLTSVQAATSGFCSHEMWAVTWPRPCDGPHHTLSKGYSNRIGALLPVPLESLYRGVNEC